MGVKYGRNGKACFVSLYMHYKVRSALFGDDLRLASPLPVSVGLSCYPIKTELLANFFALQHSDILIINLGMENVFFIHPSG